MFSKPPPQIMEIKIKEMHFQNVDQLEYALHNKFCEHSYKVKNGTSLLQAVLNAPFGISLGRIGEGGLPHPQIIKLKELIS